MLTLCSHFTCDMPYGFALHTTSPWLGLALIDCLQPIAPPRLACHELGRDMVTHLHLRAHEFLTPYTWADLQFIAVAIGPGSFTSTRLGVVMARTLSQQLDLPLFGLSTLEVAAYRNIRMQSCSTDVATPVDLSEVESADYDRAVRLNAARGDVFTGIYRYDPAHNDVVCLQPDTAMTLIAWRSRLAERSHPTIELEVSPENMSADTAAIVMLAHQRWQRGDRPAWYSVQPFYGQAPVT